jgi:flagellin
MTDDKVNTKDLFGSTDFVVSINDTLVTTCDVVSFGAASLSTTIGAAGANLSIDTAAGITSMSTAIQSIAALRADNGVDQSNLGFQLELQSAAKINQESAISRIMDVDVAEESTRLARFNTLVQAGTSMIAQANGSAQSALQLLR